MLISLFGIVAHLRIYLITQTYRDCIRSEKQVMLFFYFQIVPRSTKLKVFKELYSIRIVYLIIRRTNVIDIKRIHFQNRKFKIYFLSFNFNFILLEAKFPMLFNFFLELLPLDCRGHSLFNSKSLS